MGCGMHNGGLRPGKDRWVEERALRTVHTARCTGHYTRLSLWFEATSTSQHHHTLLGVCGAHTFQVPTTLRSFHALHLVGRARVVCIAINGAKEKTSEHLSPLHPYYTPLNPNFAFRIPIPCSPLSSFRIRGFQIEIPHIDMPRPYLPQSSLTYLVRRFFTPWPQPGPWLQAGAWRV